MSKLTQESLVLFIIVIAQFACTSLWFAGNAVVEDVTQAYALDAGIVAHITSAVQFGFILGTLIFALFTISDRFSPSRVFFVCAVLGALSNLLVLQGSSTFVRLLSRFLTGFVLAGIYPVGMKIAADHHREGLGKALGYLVGALVLGTAFPHLLKSLGPILSWQKVIITTSVSATIGGVLILLFVPDGPYRGKSSALDLSAFIKVFQKREFRSAAFGYFGHMWELYAFWAFIPALLAAYDQQAALNLNISLFSFFFIAIGGLSCVIGGYISIKVGSYKTAFYSLLISGSCCLLLPLFFGFGPPVFLAFLLLWAMTVISDSPQFSTLVAQTAPSAAKGTALTIVNSVGFFITILSIQLLNLLPGILEIPYLFTLLAVGPLLGLVSMSMGKK